MRKKEVEEPKGISTHDFGGHKLQSMLYPLP